MGDRVVVEVVGTSDSIGMHTLPVLVGSVVSSKNPTLHLRRIRINTYMILGFPPSLSLTLSRIPASVPILIVNALGILAAIVRSRVETFVVATHRARLRWVLISVWGETFASKFRSF